jgi:hypothetical protein
MGTLKPEEGIYVGLTVDASGLLGKYVEDVPRGSGLIVLPNYLAVPVLEAEELETDLSREIRRELEPALRPIRKRLADLSLRDAKFEVVSDGLEPVGGFFAGLLLEPPEVALEARSIATEVLSEKAGVHLPRAREDWFLPILRRRDPKRNLPDYQKDPPSLIKVSGLVVKTETRRTTNGNGHH